MTTTEVSPTILQENLFASLDQLATIHPYAQQWGALENLRHQAIQDPALTSMLVDYAAHSGGSQLIRAYALDIGVSAAVRAVEQPQPGAEPTKAQREICRQYRQVNPRSPYAGNSGALPFAPETGAWTLRSHPYFRFFKNLAVREGISPHLVAPRYDDLGYSPETVAPNVPEVTRMLLHRFIGGSERLDINNLSPEVARDALELVLDFRSDAYQRAVSEGDNRPAIAEFARLWRLTATGGYEHAGPVDRLYASDSEGLRYAEALNRLYDTVPLLAGLYPGIAPEDIGQGVRGLVADALFALQHSVEHGNNIDTTFAFPGGAPITMKEDSPLELIQSLTHAFQVAHYAATNLRPVFGKGSGDFHHCYFVGNNGSVPTVTYHGRPHGSETYDPQYEFSGDATSRYRVQLGDNSPVSLLNAAQTAETVSFRFDLDRFGFAFDVGALRENPHTNHPQDLEVRIGRFLAFGNYLRSRQLGVDPHMNHVRGFNVSAEAFSAGIRRYEQQLRRRALLPVGATVLVASS